MRLVGCGPCLVGGGPGADDAAHAESATRKTDDGSGKPGSNSNNSSGGGGDQNSKAGTAGNGGDAAGSNNNGGAWGSSVFGSMLSPWARIVDSISSRLAFYPPEPPSYELRDDSSDGQPYLHPNKRFFVLGVTDEAERRELDGAASPRCRPFRYEVMRLPTRRPGRPPTSAPVSEVVGVWVPYRGGEGPVLLFSHGNAVDLGIMMPFYRELTELLQVSVYSYDYSGYGRSQGSPTVSNTLLDISAAYECLLARYGKSPREVVLYGQSVGSGPSVHLAARTPELGGLILHSPLLSGVRVLHPDWKSWPAWADIYPNHRLMPQVKCPVLVMHGTDDEVVDFSHGQQLAKLAPNAVPPLWAEGYSHQNVERCPHYLPSLRAFLARVRSTARSGGN